MISDLLLYWCFVNWHQKLTKLKPKNKLGIVHSYTISPKMKTTIQIFTSLFFLFYTSQLSAITFLIILMRKQWINLAWKFSCSKTGTVTEWMETFDCHLSFSIADTYLLCWTFFGLSFFPNNWKIVIMSYFRNVDQAKKQS